MKSMQNTLYLQKQTIMKKLILIAFIAFASCSKQVDTTAQQQQTQQATAEITATVKTYAGSTPSLRITYILNSLANVKAIRLNNTIAIPVKEGQANIQDPAAGFTSNYFYFWVFDFNDGTQKTTNPKQYWY